MDSKVRYNLVGIALFLVLLFPNITSAEQYIVGDQEGWNNDVDYYDWLDGKTFYVGDVLVFNYVQGDHNVIEVDENGYNQCTTSSQIGSYTGGNDAITLTESGTRYFICEYHCDFSDQKIKVVIN